MFKLPAIVLVLFVVSLLPLRAGASDALSRAYLLPELFEIMAEEGRQSVMADGADALQGRALEDFTRAVDQIYDPARMHADFLAALMAELDGAVNVVEDALEFAETALGRQVLRLEISARRALLDEEVDEVARMALYDARRSDAETANAARLELVRARVEANDLIELNVSLGMNTSLAYYQGLFAENALMELGADDMLQMVWMQEPAIRAEIEDWIEAYFLMSYQPLSDAELEAYIAYVSTPLAQSFNRAMFRAFDAVFSEISLAVGRVLGRRMSGEEL
ncbi:MAG: DUF2059 domain-containing protein [Roseinatronobacter sp.]